MGVGGVGGWPAVLLVTYASGLNLSEVYSPRLPGGGASVGAGRIPGH